MKRIALLSAVTALAFAACSPAQEPPPVPAPEVPAPAAETAPPPAPAVTLDVLRADGIGPLTIGMTRAEVVTALGDTRTPNAAQIPGECEEFSPQRAPEGLRVMLEQGKLSRITIARDATVKTDKGLGLGDTADAVKTAYGDQAQASPHKYSEKPAEYITWWKGGPRSEPYVQDAAARGIKYEVDGTGKVSMIHAGGPSIQLVEGCA